MATINPYSSVNWQDVAYVPSDSHMHCGNATHFTNAINAGLKHIAPSNYHPSKPWYPLDEYFSNVPDDIIGSPNSEFYNMDIPFLHVNGLGSFASEPEPNSKYRWQYKFDLILRNMQYEDAGGITLNHPNWTKAYAEEQGIGTEKLKNSDLEKMLDYDNRVLGIEFYNAGSVGASEYMWDLDTWDEILLTGRRCWGFCVPDHDAESSNSSYVMRGRNVLLCSEFTEHECLKAYREGRFYGSIYDTDLKFSSIVLVGNSLSVVADNATRLEFVVDGIYHEVNGSSASYNVPGEATYVRVEAHNDENSIFSQPIIFRLRKHTDKDTAKKMLIL